MFASLSQTTRVSVAGVSGQNISLNRSQKKYFRELRTIFCGVSCWNPGGLCNGKSLDLHLNRQSNILCVIQARIQHAPAGHLGIFGSIRVNNWPATAAEWPCWFGPWQYFACLGSHMLKHVDMLKLRMIKPRKGSSAERVSTWGQGGATRYES